MAWWKVQLPLQALMALLAGALIMVAAPPVHGEGQRPEGPELVEPKRQEVLNQPEFWWKEIPGATEYRLEVAADSRFNKLLKTEVTDLNHFIDTTTWPAGSYWWRVKVTQPFQTRYSASRTFTRRWLVPDAAGDGEEIARPDNVTIEDVSPKPGLQAAVNALEISWEPVADASYYVVEFDSLEEFDPDDSTLPPSFGSADTTCVTPHTILTPLHSQVPLPDVSLPRGTVFDMISGEGECTLGEPGAYALRVRAVDVTADGRQLYSLWSDEARSESADAPGALVFSVGSAVPGNSGWAPAVQTAPVNGATYVDTPVLRWEAVNQAYGYKVVLARDPDFTTEVAHFLTTNTRLIPLGRIPEDNAERSYYWYALPCRTDFETCLTSSAAVNRADKYRSFTKHSTQVDTQSALLRPEPWLHFRWQPFTKTVNRVNREVGRPSDSVGGINYYEIQMRLRGTEWPQVGVMTDLPDFLPERLEFGHEFRWRVRVVDQSGQARPWSTVRTDRTPSAVPDNPIALRATRNPGTRLRLTWRAPKSKYFPVTNYSIYFSSTGKQWRPISQVKRTVARFKVGKKSRYWFMVTASNRAGESAPSKVYVPR